jgi:heme o synthase
MGTISEKAPVTAHAGLALQRVRDYVILTKPKIILLLAVSGLVAALVGSSGAVEPGRLGLFAVLALMSAGGSACLNQLFERDLDAQMKRTRNRPLAAGRLKPAEAAWLATVLVGVSIPAAWAWLGGMVALQLALGVLVYSGIYTLGLKRRTSLNTVIGSIAGGNMVLAGWAVVDPHLAPGAWVLAAIIFLWSPPHFWGLAIARDADYRATGFRMLPQVAGVAHTVRVTVLYAVATWAATLLMAFVAPLGGLYLTAALVLGAGFVGACVWLWLRPTARPGMAVFKISGPYLFLVLLAMVVDLVK